MSFLPQADLILVLVDGEISERGSYQELLNRNGAFADFIHTFANSERKECFSEALQRGNITTLCDYMRHSPFLLSMNTGGKS